MEGNCNYKIVHVPVTLLCFSFPNDRAYPCIPVSVDGIPVFPLTSEGIDGVYAYGSELYLSLQLGATIWVEKGYIIRTLRPYPSNMPSHSLRNAVKQLIADRNRAKAVHGKGSLEDKILKTMDDWQLF